MTLLRPIPFAFWALVIAAPLPAAAQAAATPGSVVRNGVVSLGVLPTAPSQQANPAASVAAAASASPAAGARSAAAATTSGGPGRSGAGVPAATSGVPAWLTCPPSGASGIAPFLTGTDLSCAP